MKTFNRASKRTTRLAGLAACSMLLLWTVLGVYSFHASLPRNPLSLPGEGQLDMSVWAPQRWQFFSQDPHRPRIRGFALRPDSSWIRLDNGSRAQRVNAFGWSRATQALGGELERLAGMAHRHDRAACKELPEACLSRMPRPRSTLPRQRGGSLCGQLGIAVQRPKPWGWRRSPSSMSSTVMRLEVTC